MKYETVRASCFILEAWQNAALAIQPALTQSAITIEVPRNRIVRTKPVVAMSGYDTPNLQFIAVLKACPCRGLSMSQQSLLSPKSDSWPSSCKRILYECALPASFRALSATALGLCLQQDLADSPYPFCR
jgi:hypothetical protein